ncbi:MAG: hypothetical protein QNJ33_14795 [Crocosphaera sp.]|nr:hypothetical protein [Crocosphaera sp.]
MTNLSIQKNLSTVLKQIKNRADIVVSIGLLILFVIQIFLYGQTWPKWDWLLLSGTITFIIGIELARQVPIKLKLTLRRLIDRGILVATTKDLNTMYKCLCMKADNWGQKAGIITAFAILVAFLSIYGLGNIVLTLLETLGGYIAGWFLGRMSAYGTLLPIIIKHKERKEKEKNNQFSLIIEPAHTDQVCGLKPLGDFYLFQALVAVIPAVFLATWWLIIPIFPRSYADWREPYFYLLILAIIFEILVFAIPMTLFHREMEQQKQTLLIEGDQLSRQIVELRLQLIHTESETERKNLECRLTSLLERHKKIEEMPTWPIHPKSFRRFTIRNTLLLIPLISQITGNTKFWEILQKLLEGFNKG